MSNSTHKPLAISQSSIDEVRALAEWDEQHSDRDLYKRYPILTISEHTRDLENVAQALAALADSFYQTGNMRMERKLMQAVERIRIRTKGIDDCVNNQIMAERDADDTTWRQLGEAMVSTIQSIASQEVK